MKEKPRITIQEVRRFWNNNPLCAESIPFKRGSLEYFTFYDRMREANESIEFSSGLHQYKDSKGQKVLDIGCGNGYILSRYAREGAQVFGVDITEAAVELTRKRFEFEKLKGDFCVANAEELPFRDKEFDYVCSMGVLHHTPDTERALNEFFRVLKPGGMAILMFYHRNSVFNRVILPANKILNPKNWPKPFRTMINDVDGRGNPKGDIYSKRQMQNILSGRLRQYEIFSRFILSEKLFPFKYILPPNLMERLSSRWGWFLYIKGKK